MTRMITERTPPLFPPPMLTYLSLSLLLLLPLVLLSYLLPDPFPLLFSIHSFIRAISIAPLQVHLATTQRCSRHSTDTVSEFHAEAAPATASKGHAQGPYVAARAGFRPFGRKATNVPNEPPRSTHFINFFLSVSLS